MFESKMLPQFRKKIVNIRQRQEKHHPMGGVWGKDLRRFVRKGSAPSSLRRGRSFAPHFSFSNLLRTKKNTTHWV
ncbi:MAG: hypothetical protein J6A74_04645, partial [Oscillospiraceae bacterium]|nr:hypothetical protein [Oscillospiraceae bacterium]